MDRTARARAGRILMAVLAWAALLLPSAAQALSAACQAQTPTSRSVTGTLSGGTVWGNNTTGYTTDSDLARAATHAGLVAVGASATIEVTPLDQLTSFTGTTANGITTSNYASAWCAMRLSVAGTLPAAAAPESAPPTSAERRTQFSYHASGQLSSETIEPDTPDQCLITRYTLDTFGNRSKSETAACTGASTQASFVSRATTVAFSAHSITVGTTQITVPAGTYPTQTTNALGQAETRQYDPRFGTVHRHTDARGLITQWQHDEFGRVSLQTDPDGLSTAWRYCYLSPHDTSSNSAGCQQPSQVPAHAVSYVETQRLNGNSPIGPYSRQYLDALGREIRVETQGPDTEGQASAARLIGRDTQYNPWGAAIRVSQPYFLATGSSLSSGTTAAGWTATQPDALGRPVTVHLRDDEGAATHDGQRVAQISYTYNGLRVEETRWRTSRNAGGTQQANQAQTTVRLSNPLGQLEQVIDPLGGRLTKAYDPFGNIVQTRDPLNNRVLTTYDTRGRKTQLTDPNAGTWTYAYNALGEMVRQQSPLQTTATATTFSYDRLGRLIARSEPEYTTSWRYDSYASTPPQGASCAAGLLCEVSTSHGLSRTYSYDRLGRPLSTAQRISGGPSFNSAQSYDALGRIASRTYPSGVVLSYSYTTLGHLAAIHRQGTLIYQAHSANAWGHPERYDLGSQQTRMAWDPITGRQSGVEVGKATDSAILKQGYGWDTLGNLTDRSDRYDATNTLTENFSYDALNRLAAYETSSAGLAGLSQSVTVRYDAIGNITSKSDVGSYSYPASGPGSVRPNALSSVSGSTGNRSYSYDAAGNLTASTGSQYSSIRYSSFNLPTSLNGSAGSYTWQYGPDHERIRETRGDGRVTWYHHPDNQGGMAYEQEGTTNRHYVMAAGRVVQMFETTTAAPTTVSRLQWWHADHLGSTVAITDQNNNVVQRQGYDPFGKRRSITGTADPTGAIRLDHPNATDRGYTGHEHLDDVGVIHMNGRTFDPFIGRFMQADPLVQDSTDAQNFNRYSYVLNNPLNATDPSGHSFKKLVRMAVVVAIAYYTGNWMTTMSGSAIAGGAAGGFTSGLVAGKGDIDVALRGALMGGAFGYVGDTFAAGSFGNYAGHAVVGCLGGAMNGGSCGRGAVSELVAKGATNATAEWDAGTQFMATVVAGGTASVVGGGKFANGAMTAAYAYLFNELAHYQGTTDERYALAGYATADPVSNARIWQLDPWNFDPSVKLDVVTAINAVNAETGLQLRVVQGFRTWEEQDDFYALGRTKAGKIVTQARGGQSNHNFGLAIDVVGLLPQGGVSWNINYGLVNSVMRRYGFAWGGDWKSFRDQPHFERKVRTR